MQLHLHFSIQHTADRLRSNANLLQMIIKSLRPYTRQAQGGRNTEEPSEENRVVLPRLLQLLMILPALHGKATIILP